LKTRRKDTFFRRYPENGLGAPPLLKNGIGPMPKPRTTTLYNVEAIDDRKLSEKALKKAREVTQSARLSKSRFLADVSHEIRTPINAVIGFTDLLLDTELDDTQNEYVQSIKRSGVVLLSLVNDILDVTRIDAGELVFEKIAFDPELLAHDVCDLVRHKIGNRPLELLCRIDDHLPTMVIGDPLRFRQIITNLMANALQFTENGEVELSIKLVDETSSAIKLHASVRDTGIGIPEEKQAFIFEPFRQADNSTTRKFGGTGLGLSICKRISNMMGGDVRVVSRPGEGSTFHFTAWLEKCETVRPRSAAPASLNGLRVLIVDDSTSNVEILVKILGAAGIAAASVQRGKDALPALQAAMALETPFDLCMIDALLPDISGKAVADQIRAFGGPLAHMPLIALSGSMGRDSQQCEKAGFTGFLSKPVRRQNLMRVIERVAQHCGEAIGNRINPPEKIHTQYSVREDLKHSVRILLAEDNPVNQQLTRLMLEKAGYRVTVVGDGLEAVETYVAANDRFDLILMDLQMPEMDGAHATRNIRESGYENVPVVAMTARVTPGDREKCLQAGMNDYLTKPISRESVFKMIEKYVIDKATL